MSWGSDPAGVATLRIRGVYPERSRRALLAMAGLSSVTLNEVKGLRDSSPSADSSVALLPQNDREERLRMTGKAKGWRNFGSGLRLIAMTAEDTLQGRAMCNII